MLKYIINIAVSLSFDLKSFLKGKKNSHKKVSLCKKETFFLFFSAGVMICTPVYGDIAIGILRAIDNNAKVHLLYNNAYVGCEPFGVLPLEKMAASAVNPKECSSRIEQLYRSFPHDKVFAREHLLVSQSYHFEKGKTGCILYANGPETYSEMLLAHGLALIDPNYNNSEWNEKLRQAQKRGENLKAGLYESEIKKFCIKEEK